MFPQPTVLLATDLSARCDRALDRALIVAEQLAARLLIVNVIEKGELARDIGYDEWLKSAIIRDLPVTQVAIEVVIRRGSVPQSIAKIAQEENCALIVTGVARYNSLRDFLLGTLVDTLVRSSDIPVLIVKQRPQGRYKRILAATDFSSCSRRAIEVSAKFFPEIPVRLAHAYHTPYSGWLSSESVAKDTREEAEEELTAFLTQPDFSDSLRGRLSPEIVYGDINAAIHHQIETFDPDLVALGTHGKSGFVQATIGSVATDLMSWIPADTLVVRETR